MFSHFATNVNKATEITKTHYLNFMHRPNILTSEILSYGGKGIAFAPYGDHWRQMRKLCVTKLLSTKRVQSFASIREDECAKFIKLIENSVGSEMNLTGRIFSLVCASVSRVLFGGKYKEQDEYLVSLIRQVLVGSGGFDLADLFPSMKFLYFVKRAKLEGLRQELDRVLENVIKEHKKKQKSTPGEEEEDNKDLVDVLLRIQHSDTLDIKINDIKAFLLEIFAAATDTSASTIEWAMTEMMRNPRVRERAQSELIKVFRGKETIHESDVEQLTYLKLVVKETLRLHPPTPLLLPRECSQVTIIDGYEIPIKTKVMINVWAIGKDPEYWNDGEKFIPERFEGSSIDFKGNNFEYLPFGAGRRICPGMTFALATIIHPLALLLYYFNWELPNKMKPEDMNMVEQFGLAIVSKQKLHLIPFVYDV
ncbi:hypothetical protein VNO78_21548 [Psophocarpus tetragonolobus]|uniref:Cytochrome P450 n=1 Tax=Psophocarpus tetragonolobus TaxID=3891 RepID=A0AAN9SDI0_PSOTE